MNITKRDGQIVEFDLDKIINAVHRACLEVDPNTSRSFAEEVAIEVSFEAEQAELVTVEKIQDWVEESLLQRDLKMAKTYILYRNMKDKNRGNKKKYKLLSDEFLSKYKHRPSPLNDLGNFVFYRTYSRFLPEEERREYWWETLARAIDYNCSLSKHTTREEAEELYDNAFNLKQQLSGRTLYTGNTQASNLYPLSNFNCSNVVIDKIDAMVDLFYVLMVGTGVGASIQAEYTDNLPPFRTDINLYHEEWEFTPKPFREEITGAEVNGDTMRIIIGDSKEGFMEALRLYLNILTNNSYRTVKNVIVNYNFIRPKGERLVTFGGTASGYENMKNMLFKIHKVVTSQKNGEKKVRLRKIDILDILNIIGQNVVSGGVRRTAELLLIDRDDVESKLAKENLYKMNELGKWVMNEVIAHRSVSNNSVIYETKPTREELHEHIKMMRYSGEPGMINAEAARRRRPNFKGVNPCGEILMDANAVCNLTTNNILAFVINGLINMKLLKRAIELSVRAGYRMTLLELELPHWNKVHKRDRLLGVSLTGYQDAVTSCNMSIQEQKDMLTELRETAHRAMKQIAEEEGLNESLLTTTVKPEGSLSQVMGGVSSGLHFSHSEYYIRRIRISANDALVKVCEDLGWTIHPENGQTEEDCNTKVIDFPMHSPAKKFKKDVTAIEQLEIYKMFQTFYTDHNTSNTIHVRDNEWGDVEEWLWENWDEFIGVSFLSYSDSFYKLLPYEAIDKETYEKLAASMKAFNPSMLKKYETTGESELDEETCANGGCAVR